jgi:hypothetical protein
LDCLHESNFAPDRFGYVNYRLESFTIQSAVAAALCRRTPKEVLLMPGWLKGLLIAFVIILVLGGIVIGIGVFYVMRNKDAWIAQGKAVAEEGRSFGNTTDNQGCVDESLGRYKKDPGLKGVLSNTIFMRTCLDVSKPTPGFCDDVPKQMEFMKTAEWRLKKCRLAGMSGDSNCQNLFTPIQQFCETPSKRGRDSNANQGE